MKPKFLIIAIVLYSVVGGRGKTEISRVANTFLFFICNNFLITVQSRNFF